MENFRTEVVMKAQELYERLRVMRNDYASERGLRPFRVMTNRTLCTVVIMKPVTYAQFVMVKGIYEKYRDDLASLMVPAIREFLGAEEVGRREALEWVEPMGRDDVDDGDLELYDILPVRRKRSVDPEVPEEDRDLYELLRRIRVDLAKDAGWPPYCIMTNRTLRAVASRKPLTVDDFGAIPGISARRRDESGELFVSAILEYLTA